LEMPCPIVEFDPQIAEPAEPPSAASPASTHYKAQLLLLAEDAVRRHGGHFPYLCGRPALGKVG
jgi:hypothetical protein